MHGMKLIHYQPIMKGHEASPTFAAQDKFLALAHVLLTISPGDVSALSWCVYLYPSSRRDFLTMGFRYNRLPSHPQQLSAESGVARIG